MTGLRILFVAPMYYPRVGGVEYVVKSIAEQLVRLGHEVVVLAGDPEIKEARSEEINKVNVIRWPTWSPGGAYHIPKFKKKLETKLGEIIHHFDVIHIHSVHTVLSVWIGQKLEKNKYSGEIVITPHYHGTGHTFIRKLLWIPWRHNIKRLLKCAKVHAVSTYEASLLKNHFNIESIVIEHGVDEEVLRYE